jgi:hypothetical protein
MTGLDGNPNIRMKTGSRALTKCMSKCGAFEIVLRGVNLFVQQPSIENASDLRTRDYLLKINLSVVISRQGFLISFQRSLERNPLKVNYCLQMYQLPDVLIFSPKLSSYSTRRAFAKFAGKPK